MSRDLVVNNSFILEYGDINMDQNKSNKILTNVVYFNQLLGTEGTQELCCDNLFEIRRTPTMCFARMGKTHIQKDL